MAESSSTRVASTSIDALAAQFLEKMLRRKKDVGRPEQQPDSGQKTPPWETWELNKNFFRALSRWTLDNPETSLDRVLDYICDGLENNKDLFQMIPDAPFPARGLVIALAHLFKLGVKTPRAKQDVRKFAKDVIRWVGLVRSAFEAPGDGYFTRQAWQNLRDMRELIDEACLWAVKRLEDGRWSRIGHGLRIQNEIQEFNIRMTDARVLFQDLSSISQAKGLDVILQRFHGVERQEAIITEIRKLREAQEKQLNEIMSELEMQKQVAERNRFFAETLHVRTVANPTYDGQGKRPCDEDTRTEVLDEIRHWTNDTSPGAPNFLWLTGDPGCGKSAVTASLARECKDLGVLWAQFFINRNNAETTDPRLYFPSIARQLAARSTDVAETIHGILQKQLSLLDDISADQASKLFINSVCVASQAEPDKPVVVIIDGLDETSRDRLEDTAKIFSTLFTSLETYNNVKVFISSRTENEIQKSFVLPRNSKYVKHIHLDTAEITSIRDVSHYIRRNLLELVRAHDLNWDVWPGEDRSQILGQRASGLFIWGVTAIKFIQEQLHSHGEECLDEVLNMLTADVLHDINALYMLILNVTHRDHQDDWELERFRRIVGAIVFLQEPLCIDDLAELLDLRKAPSSKPVDIAHFVRRMRTILATGADAIDGNTVPRIHKSVFEFIISNSVDPKFRVDPEHAHLELAVQCLVCFNDARREPGGKDILSTPFRYASRFWYSHLTQANTIGSSAVCADFRHSLSSSLASPSAPFIHKPIWVQYLSATSRITIQTGTWDAVSGASIPNTARITCMLFSPDSKEIVLCSDDRTIEVWDFESSEWVRTLVEYSSCFNAISFSPDSMSIVSASDDALVRLWNYSTGAPLGEPLQGHKQGVTCVAFSPDGAKIISGSVDETCILWDVQQWRAVWAPWAGHETGVAVVAFSANGRRVCSISYRGHAFIRDVSTGHQISSWTYEGYPFCVSFLPKEDDVVVIGGLAGIEIGSHNQPWSIFGSRDTRWLSFLSDGEQVVFGNSMTISVAEIDKANKTSHIVGKDNYPRSNYVLSSALSPNFEHFAYADETHTLHLFALQHDKLSIKAVPLNTGTRPPRARKNHDDKRLMDYLANMTKMQKVHGSVQITNRRLSGIEWYEMCVAATDAAESAIKVCVLRDDASIVGYSDGSISVWEHRDQDLDSGQEVSRHPTPTTAPTFHPQN